jgi:peptidoglycan/LPS O-acetylase OafA/YrhL
MLVFLFRRGRYLPGGIIGVAIFFVLRGYLITSSRRNCAAFAGA